jgi:hypothetical protein
MSWVVIYIATNFLAPIPCISLRIVDLSFKFPPKSTNSSRRSPNRKKPISAPEKVGPPEIAGLVTGKSQTERTNSSRKKPSRKNLDFPSAKAGHHLVNATTLSTPPHPASASIR